MNEAAVKNLRDYAIKRTNILTNCSKAVSRQQTTLLKAPASQHYKNMHGPSYSGHRAIHKKYNTLACTPLEAWLRKSKVSISLDILEN